MAQVQQGFRIPPPSDRQVRELGFRDAAEWSASASGFVGDPKPDGWREMRSGSAFPVREVSDQLAFVLAGRARFSLRNSTTGNHLTFSVEVGDGESAPHFVSLLVGPDNEGDYQHVGTIFEGRRFVVAKRYREAGAVVPRSVVVFGEVFRRLVGGRSLPPSVELWHAGRCARCGRTLTDPASIARGLGPVCVQAS